MKNTCGATQTHESNNRKKKHQVVYSHSNMYTEEHVGYPAHTGMCSVEHFEPYSIISVLRCQRLWERATTHSLGSSQCLLQKPMRFIIKARAPVACTLWTWGKLSWPWFNVQDSLLKSIFFLFLFSSLGSFYKFQGRLSRHFVIISKKKMPLEISEVDIVILNWYLPSSKAWRLVYTQKLTQRWIIMQITANIYTTKTVLEHPCALGPHLFMPIACSNARIILQRNFIWRHSLTLTVHKVQFHTFRLPNRRTEQWEQTHCLIRAEVGALERWNAKAKSPLLP